MSLLVGFAVKATAMALSNLGVGGAIGAAATAVAGNKLLSKGITGVIDEAIDSKKGKKKKK